MLLHTVFFPYKDSVASSCSTPASLLKTAKDGFVLIAYICCRPNSFSVCNIAATSFLHISPAQEGRLLKTPEEKGKVEYRLDPFLSLEREITGTLSYRNPATCLKQHLGSTQIKTYSWDNAQVILVGNKCDMEDERVISTERGKHLAEQLGFEFFETSAKDNINVKQTFERLVDIICDKMSESLETDPAIAAGKQNTRLKDTPPPQQPNCGC
ncbi:ras-related protein Rab-3C isoform X4 [Caretta caretta]|uniref:ras-related protein Rab-3C isoform X4 n=1 Tax=Caretta caretta TaxID=8467 RepID=UPI003F4C4181